MKTRATDVSCIERSGGKRLAARREAFLAAAREVFVEKGYAEATLDDVIARSGGSRQTLYALFGGKQGCSKQSSAKIARRFSKGYRRSWLNVHPRRSCARSEAAILRL